jgi:sugar porter (SP) family MFS transporter
MTESDISTGITRDRYAHDVKSAIGPEKEGIDSPIYSRPSSPDSLIKLLPEALDGPLAFIDAGISRKPLILPAQPYIYGGIAAMTTFAYGFNAGIISFVFAAVQKEWKLSKNSYSLTFIVSSMLAGAVLGSILPGWIGSDRIGRKPMLLITNAILIVGAFASFFSQNAAQLILSRTVTGLGIGVGSIMPGLYITEMSPASIRGFLGILNQFSGFVGILASYCADLIFTEAHWQRIFLLAGSMALLAFIFSAVVLLESPRWLISHGFNKGAMEVLEKIYGRHNGNHSSEEFEKIYAHLSRPQSSTKLQLPRKTLTTIVALQLIQQVAGSGFVTYYSASIFRSWGLSSRESTVATILSALPLLFVFGIVAKWVEALGRRRLLLMSEFAMALVLIYLGMVTFLVGPKTNVSHLQAVLVFIGLASHRVAYALGLAPVPTVLIAEILPFSLRNHGLALALTLNWFLNFLITSLIPMVAGLNSLSTVYFVMAMFSVISFLYTSKNISETRGVLLEATEEMHLFPVMPSDPESRNNAFTSISIDSKALEAPMIPSTTIHPESKNFK